MMAKVVNEFVDKYTGVLHEKGSTFNCTEERFIEIKKAGCFLEEIKTSEAPEPKKENNNQKPFIKGNNRKGK